MKRLNLAPRYGSIEWRATAMIEQAGTASFDVKSRARTRVHGFAVMLAALLLAGCTSRQGSQTGSKPSEEQALRDRIALLSRQEQILTAEIALAKNPAPYLALDLKNRRIDFKVQGHSLRGFPITKISRSGDAPFVVQTWMGIEARPLQAPVRARVVPGSGEETTSSTATKEPWGPKRMPADYDLLCKGDQALQIRSLLSDPSRSRFTRWIVSSYRQVREWARERIGGGKSIHQESIEIWMGEDDAELLFWSLPRQFGILLMSGP
jgi:outer membrane murein-binding lipoprotein Lpp